jgi:hypothetical protein
MKELENSLQELKEKVALKHSPHAHDTCNEMKVFVKD